MSNEEKQIWCTLFAMELDRNSNTGFCSRERRILHAAILSSRIMGLIETLGGVEFLQNASQDCLIEMEDKLSGDESSEFGWSGAC